MKFNNKVLYALLTVGALMPTASVQAWSWGWGGAAPLVQKTQEKVVEEAKKEAAKKSSVVADLAWKGTKAVGTAAAQTAWFTTKETAKFAYNNPRTAATLAGAGYLYYNRESLSKWFNKKYEQAKGIANTVAPLATAAIAAKLAHDAFGGLALPAAQSAVVAQAEPKKDASVDAKLTLKTKEDLEMEALVNEYLAFEQGEKQVERIEQHEKDQRTMENAWNQSKAAIAQEKSNILKRAQERIQMAQFNQVWEEQKAQAVKQPVSIDQVDQELVKMLPALNKPASHDVLSHLNINTQEAERFANDFVNPREGFLIEPVQVPVVVPVATQADKHAWVQEYNELEKAEPLTPRSQWAQEFNDTEAASNRANTILRHLFTDSSDDDVASVESAEDISSLNAHKEMETMNNTIRERNLQNCL